MKLYTEEQVDKMLSRARLHKQDDTEMFANEYLLSEETPIELPSDEDMEKKAESFYPISKEYKAKYKNDYNDFNTCWQEGAKWLKEQILNQNK